MSAGSAAKRDIAVIDRLARHDRDGAGTGHKAGGHRGKAHSRGHGLRIDDYAVAASAAAAAVIDPAQALRSPQKPLGISC